MLSYIKNKLSIYLNNRLFKNTIKKNIELKNIDNVLNSLSLNKIRPRQIEKFAPKNILVIAPHPDDEVIGPGGTLIKEIKSGSTVTVLFVTGNNQSGRKQEALSVAEFLQFSSVFLDQEDGDISIETEALSDFADILNNIQPDKIYVPFLCDDHDDHKRVNQLLLEACVQGYVKNQKIEIWCYQIYTVLPSNYIVDITDVIDKKKTAICKYKSQLKNRDWAHWASGLNAFNTRFLPGSPDKRYAETFLLIKLSEYLDICEHYFTSKASNYNNIKYM